MAERTRENGLERVEKNRQSYGKEKQEKEDEEEGDDAGSLLDAEGWEEWVVVEVEMC